MTVPRVDPSGNFIGGDRTIRRVETYDRLSRFVRSFENRSTPFAGIVGRGGTGKTFEYETVLGDPDGYLRDVLTRIHSHPVERIHELAPRKTIEFERVEVRRSALPTHKALETESWCQRSPKLSHF
jgi:Cdc6-like AAA superfamily ATPase